MKIFTYSESDKEYILVDGRNIDATRYRKRQVIKMLCTYYGCSGLIVLAKSDSADFKMEAFGCDGMPVRGCGTASAVSFADLLGINGFYADHYDVETPDGVVRAEIVSRNGEEKKVTFPDGMTQTALCEGECCSD